MGSLNQSYDLHRALLQPSILSILRAAGFHSTRPSVLDTLTNLAERYLLLLAATTADFASRNHNDPIPTIGDVRAALRECGATIPLTGGAEEEWEEILRKGLDVEADDTGDGEEATTAPGQQRVAGAKRKREEYDTRDIRNFAEWNDGPQMVEIRRVAGLTRDTGSLAAAAGIAPSKTGVSANDSNTLGSAGAPGSNSAAAAAAAVGVGGGIVQAEDWLTTLKKKYASKGFGAGGDEGRLANTVLSSHSLLDADREVFIEGGPVGSIKDWKPRRSNQVPDRGEGRSAVQAARDDTMGDVEQPITSSSLPDAREDDADDSDEDDRPLKDIAIVA